MELDKFLSDTLINIVSGVKDANKKLGDGQFVIYNTKENVIEFDIAVIISGEKTKVAEGSLSTGFRLMGFSLGGKKESHTSDKNISRLKFKVKPRLKIE